MIPKSKSYWPAPNKYCGDLHPHPHYIYHPKYNFRINICGVPDHIIDKRINTWIQDSQQPINYVAKTNTLKRNAFPQKSGYYYSIQRKKKVVVIRDEDEIEEDVNCGPFYGIIILVIVFLVVINI